MLGQINAKQLMRVALPNATKPNGATATVQTQVTILVAFGSVSMIEGVYSLQEFNTVKLRETNAASPAIHPPGIWAKS